MKAKNGSTERTQQLYDLLIDRAQGDRSGEWFNQEKFPDLFTEINPEDYGLVGKLETKTVLIRRAIATDVMLKAMTDKENFSETRTMEIAPGDLLLGVLPMGSNGLGKVFPQFMTPDELRAGSVTNRNTMSMFGHNTMNYEKLLSKGVKSIITDCDTKIAAIEAKEGTETLATDTIVDQQTEQSQRIYKGKTRKDFYVGVKIACEAVINYAERFAKIAEEAAEDPSVSDERKSELKNMADIARKVPKYPAETFHEAMQSITFFHIALHSAMNFISLGRLDQVLQPYLANEKNKDVALEVVECFLIKLAGRLNLSSRYLKQQDYVDYATVLGTNAYYIDQKAGVNNFLQNIIIGGLTPKGKDATNDATFLLLQATENVNLSTPGIYVRIHKDTGEDLLKAVAKTLMKTGNNPAVINDEVMIPAMYETLMQKSLSERQRQEEKSDEEKKKLLELARDYCVDGCWEPILNGKSDWTFTMFNALTALGTSMNQGASLSPEPELFRGAKIAPYVKMPESFEEFMETYKSQLSFFVDQRALSLFLYYLIDEYAAPSPLFSAFLDGCMERGRDKSWAGADYNLAGIIFGGVPDTINTMLGIQKWVFPKDGCGKYSLQDVADAFKYNFICGAPANWALQSTYSSIQVDFSLNTPKFGQRDDDVAALTRQVLDICYDAVMDSAEFAKKVYQDKPAKEDWKNIIALRRLTGYYGSALGRKYEDFSMKVTVGLGTFEQYNWSGRGLAASADRRSGDPIAPNFTPMPGTTNNGAAELIQTFNGLGLERFAGGVITDICLDENKGVNEDVLCKLLSAAIENKAGMFTISIGSEKQYREIYEKAQAANSIADDETARELLKPYAGVNVRIGGWQTPFITLPISHMENYINRPTSS